MAEEKTLVKGLHFFIESDDCLWFTEKFVERNYDEREIYRKFSSIDDCSFDFISVPYHLTIKAGDDIILSFYYRSEHNCYDEDNAALIIALHTNGKDPDIVKDDIVLHSAAISGIMINALKASVILREYIVNNNLMDQFANLDMNTEGILVKRQKSDMIFERVSGMKRPSLVCILSTTLKRQEMRPYPDEMKNTEMIEKMSFEKKLEAAEACNEIAMEQVAVAYLNGDENNGIESNPGKAAYWLFKLAELDNPMGCFNLAILFIKGQGVEQNFEQALHWIGRALLNGNEEAVLYASRLREIVDLKEKISTGDLSAKVDLARAYLWLGTMLGDDFYDIFNQKSVALAEEAEAAGIVAAEWVLGYAYEKGLGVASDMGKAIEHYRRGAELGNDICQYMLGSIYLVGDDVPTNPKKGFELYMKSAWSLLSGRMWRR